MAEHKHEDLRRLFDLVIAAPPSERATILARECGSDAGLRQRLEAMIVTAEEDDRFLAAPTGDVLPSPSAVLAATIAAPLAEGAGTRIGVYKLLQEIGEGGFGSVFMAEQEKPVQRRVALKIIKLGMDTRQVVARFEQERQALALMDHPNIARVLDAGATETGRPYFVMDLVKGEPIVAYCDKNNLSIEDRLELFAQVCMAVQHAHTKGIIHRDIKPSNILVSTQDGRPQAKVIDFGIAKATNAKLTEKTLFTEHRQLIGTPEYMSPEQAEGSLDIDTRTDVYSLGVLLYQLLTGSTPFSSKELRSAAFGEIQRIIREVEPPKPSTRLSQNSDTLAGVAAQRRTEPRKLGALVRGELDWIVMKALEKERQRRYETANGLAMDIQRYLSGEPVQAAPPSATYRLRTFVRRHKGAVGAVAAVAAALLIGVVGFAWQAKIARDQRDLAVVAQQAEAEQRRVADEQRDRAVAAEAETKKRAAELEQVSEFQSKMLSQIDPNAAGERLMSDIRERFDAVLKKSGVTEAERATRGEVFSKELGEVNATDTAVELIDETILKPAIEAVNTQFKDQPVVDASLRGTLGILYFGLGRYDDALPLAEQALATRRRVLGEEHSDTLKSLNDLGRILEEKGDLARAEACYREAIENRKRASGKDTVETLQLMGNLGNFLRAQGKFAEAEPLLRESLDGYRRMLGAEHRDTLIAMNSYGYLLIETGKVKEAEAYWREAYETGKRVLGADDPDVLVWTNNMGGLLGSMGRYREAEPYYREAMERTRRVHGLEHPGTLMCVMSYAGVLNSLGRSAEAEPYYREALDARRRTLGSDHPDTLMTLANLGNALRDQQKYAEAEQCLRESLEGKRRTLGNDNPSTINGVGLLARLYTEQGRLDESEAQYRGVLETAKRVWGEENPSYLVFLNNFGNVLILGGKYTEAEGYIRQSLDTRLRISGPDHPETLVSMSAMGRLLEEQGKYDEAEPLFRDVLKRFRRVLGNNHMNTVNAITNLGAVLREQGKFVEAEPLWREAATTLERTQGKDSSRTGNARLGLGALIGMKRFGEAETELVEAERVYSSAAGVSLSRHRASVEAMADLYAAWDEAEPGAGHDGKAAEWKSRLDAMKAAAAEKRAEGRK